MPALTLDIAADFYQRYRGEPVTVWVRVAAAEPAAGFTLQVGVPDGLTVDTAEAVSAGEAVSGPEFAHADGARYVLWTVSRALAAGERLEFRLTGTIGPVDQDVQLETVAVLSPAGPGPAAHLSRALVITVAAQGRYVRFLPALYQEADDFMARFLMLFESLWKPIFERLDGLPHYFDPRTAPPDLLPWLATWVNLTLDERWPEAKRRKLLTRAVRLYRQRGTKAGLQEYLEIYTDVKPRILEQGAQNFRLGAQARLGPDVALGTGNQPHTFRVILPLPEEPDERRARERQRIVTAIVEAEKPAHTAYTLELPAAPAAQ